jgi:hypothetical protein
MATRENKRTVVSPQSDHDLTIKRISASLGLIADAVDELSEMGQKDLDRCSALGFSNVIRSCGNDLDELTKTVGSK